MMETTIEILTQYPFQVLLVAMALRGALRAGLEELTGSRRGGPRLEPTGRGTQVA